jgi:hydrogenase-4 component F
LFLVVIFIGMGTTVLTVVQGPTSPAGATTADRDTLWNTASALVALAVVVMMGVWIPGPLYEFVQRAAAMLEHAP